MEKGVQENEMGFLGRLRKNIYSKQKKALY